MNLLVSVGLIVIPLQCFIVNYVLNPDTNDRRFPFLLVDRVVELEYQKSGVGYKNITINDQFFPGHFPERAIMPGVRPPLQLWHPVKCMLMLRYLLPNIYRYLHHTCDSLTSHIHFLIQNSLIRRSSSKYIWACACKLQGCFRWRLWHNWAASLCLTRRRHQRSSSFSAASTSADSGNLSFRGTHW